MDPTTLDLAWFLSTAYGKAWVGPPPLDEVVYENAYLIASMDPRMIDVLRNCPALYAQALSMYIAIILTQQGGNTTAPVIDPAVTDKVAYVTRDKVYDTERQYTLVDAPKETSGALPSNILSRIFEDCRSISAGMRLIKGSIGCGSCGNGSGNINVGDMSDG